MFIIKNDNSLRRRRVHLVSLHSWWIFLHSLSSKGDKTFAVSLFWGGHFMLFLPLNATSIGSCRVIFATNYGQSNECKRGISDCWSSGNCFLTSVFIFFLVDKSCQLLRWWTNSCILMLWDLFLQSRISTSGLKHPKTWPSDRYNISLGRQESYAWCRICYILKQAHRARNGHVLYTK